MAIIDKGMYELAMEMKCVDVHVIDQGELIDLAINKYHGMEKQILQVCRGGLCAVLTLAFIKRAMLGKLKNWDKNAMMTDIMGYANMQMASLLALGFNNGERKKSATEWTHFEILAKKLSPRRVATLGGGGGMNFLQAMKSAVSAGVNALAKCVVIQMVGDGGGHIIGLKVVKGGTCTYFDANTGIYRFVGDGELDKLRELWRKTYEMLGYSYSLFMVTEFLKMPEVDHMG